MTTRNALRSSESERNYGYVKGVSGPVVAAENMFGASMHELVHIGHNQLFGEVVRLNNDIATIQVYEDTSGVSVGEPVLRTGKQLSVELGPGILGNIFDGIQRPLKDIAELSSSIYLPKGLHLPAISRSVSWEFSPSKKLGRGNGYVKSGDVIGLVEENSLLKHVVMVPPNFPGEEKLGKVVYMAPYGYYTVEDILMEAEFPSGIERFGMMQIWPVRRTRPVTVKLRPDYPLLTGQRVLDAFFPCAQGGTTAISGVFGCGKTLISQSISKYSNSDVIVYVGCGERGNEMSQVLRDFSKMTIELRTQDNAEKCVIEPIMKRSVLVANTSNMPVAAREASIYTGVTIAEYFRDQGYNVTMMADSTSRWAEALREISGRIGEVPADSGYPAYLTTKLSSFYARAGKARCLGRPSREGSLAIIGALSPPGGEISDPVSQATLSVVQTFWSLDSDLSRRKHFPAVNLQTSYSKYHEPLEKFFSLHYPELKKLRKYAHKILLNEQEFTETARLTGTSSLSESEKLTLEIAKVLKQDFLQQDAYSSHDAFCPFYKTLAILRNIVLFHKSGTEALETCENNVTCSTIRREMTVFLHRISAMRFVDPSTNQKRGNRTEFDHLNDDIKRAFKKFRDSK